MSEFESAPTIAVEPAVVGRLAATKDAIDGFSGRIADSLRNGYESLQQKSIKYKMFGTAAIAAFSLAHAERAVAEPDSVAFENPPTLSGPAFLSGLTEEDTPTSLTSEEIQQCEDIALASPEVVRKPVLYHAGIRLQQIMQVGLLYPPLPDNCAPNYIRSVGGFEQTKKHGRWVTTLFGVGGVTGNQEQRSSGGIGPSHATPAWVYDECINGRFEKHRLVLRSSFRSGEPGGRAVIAEKQHILPVRVQGNCQAAIRSRKRYQNAS